MKEGAPQTSLNASDEPSSVLGIGSGHKMFWATVSALVVFPVWLGRKDKQSPIKDLRLRKDQPVGSSSPTDIQCPKFRMPQLLCLCLHTSSDGELTLSQGGIVLAFTWQSSTHASRPSSHVALIPEQSSLLEQTHFFGGKEMGPM